MVKQCGSCKNTLDESMFHKRTYSSGTIGLQNKCKECQKNIRRGYWKPHEVMRRKFKITDEQFIKMMKPDDCPCCGRRMEKKCIDHCHKTEKIRGVICNNCNTALGLIDDNKETLSNLIQYLERSEQLLSH